MLKFILILIGVMSITSIIINYIFYFYYGHEILMRINQFLMYGVACISVIAAYIYRENQMIVSIAITAAIIGIIKSFSYYKFYIDFYEYFEKDEADDKERNINGTKED